MGLGPEMFHSSFQVPLHFQGDWRITERSWFFMFLNVDTGIKNKNWGAEEKNCINEKQGFYQHDKEIALDAWFGCVFGRLIGRPNMMKDSVNACIFKKKNFECFRGVHTDVIVVSILRNLF